MISREDVVKRLEKYRFDSDRVDKDRADLDEFTETWPVERLAKMPLIEYYNLQDPDCFMYWLEYRKAVMGIKGGSASKWGIFRRKKDNLYQIRDNGSTKTLDLADAEEVWLGLRDQILSAIKCAQSGQFDQLFEIGMPLSSSVQTKILVHYAPLYFTPLAKREIIIGLGLALGLGSKKQLRNMPPLKLNYLVTKSIKDIPSCRNWDFAMRGNALWNCFQDLVKKKSNQESNTIRLVKISPGEKGVDWDRQRAASVAAIGWNASGDLTHYDDDDDFSKAAKICVEKGQGKRESHISDALETFYETDANTYFLYYVQGKIKGIAKSTDHYTFDETIDHGHQIDVEFIEEFEPVDITGSSELRSFFYDNNTVCEIDRSDLKLMTALIAQLEKTNPSIDWQRTFDFNEEVEFNDDDYDFRLNTIFVGPPGTGKTRRVCEIMNRHFTDDEGVGTRYSESQISNLYWWEVIAACIEAEGRPLKVSEIRGHEIFQIKVKCSNNNSIDQTLWGNLLKKTVDSITDITTQRQPPLIFNRSKNTEWSLVENWREMVSESRIHQEKKAVGEKRYEIVTFHQSYSYEEFVEGLKPDADENNNLIYLPVPGKFRQICRRAHEDREKKYAIVIDEINRGNVSEILGELITLIEESKRSRKDKASLPVALTYSKDEFSIPENLYIFGTMNTADKSVAPLDFALRRRFHFVEIWPIVAVIRDNWHLTQVSVDEVCRVFNTINDKIEITKGRDFMLGHSYFLGIHSPSDLREMFYNQLIPLLMEYFYEDWETLKFILGEDVFVKSHPSASRFGDALPSSCREVYQIVTYKSDPEFCRNFVQLGLNPNNAANEVNEGE